MRPTGFLTTATTAEGQELAQLGAALAAQWTDMPGSIISRLQEAPSVATASPAEEVCDLTPSTAAGQTATAGPGGASVHLTRASEHQSSSATSSSSGSSDASSSSRSSSGEPSSLASSSNTTTCSAAAAAAAAAVAAADATSIIVSKAADNPSGLQEAAEPNYDPSQPAEQHDTAAGKGSSSSSSSAGRTRPQRKPWPHCQALHDTLDFLSLLLTTTSLILAAVLCALCLQNPNLAWVGVLLSGFTVAAPVAVGGIILARNHWLMVVLRYCLSVAALQRDTGLSFRGLRYVIARAMLSWVVTLVLGIVGFVVAIYLSACYVVSGRRVC
jgi:hypothetical protein